MNNIEKFAKIIVTTAGNQILFYVEPDGNNFICHQIISNEFGAIDLKLGFCKPDADENETNAYAYLESVSQSTADKIEQRLNELVGE